MNFETIQNAANHLKNQYTGQPRVGLILGSGLGVLADEIQNAVKIPYKEIKLIIQKLLSVLFVNEDNIYFFCIKGSLSDDGWRA